MRGARSVSANIAGKMNESRADVHRDRAVQTGLGRGVDRFETGLEKVPKLLRRAGRRGIRASDPRGTSPPSSRPLIARTTSERPSKVTLMFTKTTPGAPPRRTHASPSHGSRGVVVRVARALELSFVLGVTTLSAACASMAPPPEAALQPKVDLERMCMQADGRVNERACFLVPGDGSITSGVFELGRGVWARLISTPAGASKVALDRTTAHGLFAERPTGVANMLLTREGAIDHATLSGPMGLAWRWDRSGSLAQLDLVWRDSQVTITHRGGGATRVQVVAQGSHFWESTVSVDPQAEVARGEEAWVADGPVAVPMPKATGLGGIFPLCPIGDEEHWEGWNGRFAQTQTCLRKGEPWLVLERDWAGRITSIAEARVPRQALGEEAAGFEANRREIRIEWRDDSVTPERIVVLIDGRPDGLEARFSPRGLPNLTRHFRQGKPDGLEIAWQYVRAQSVRRFKDGVGEDLEVVTRWTEGRRATMMPELRGGLEPEAPAAGSSAGLWE